MQELYYLSLFLDLTLKSLNSVYLTIFPFTGMWKQYRRGESHNIYLNGQEWAHFLFLEADWTMQVLISRNYISNFDYPSRRAKHFQNLEQVPSQFAHWWVHNHTEWCTESSTSLGAASLLTICGVLLLGRVISRSPFTHHNSIPPQNQSTNISYDISFWIKISKFSFENPRINLPLKFYPVLSKRRIFLEVRSC